MNDIRDTKQGAEREKLIEQFLERSLDEVEQMRRSVPQLIKGDAATWQEVRFCAQRMSASAKLLDFGVLGACATELARIADEKFAGSKLDETFLVIATTAIETVALELNQLAAARPGKSR